MKRFLKATIIMAVVLSLMAGSFGTAFAAAAPKVNAEAAMVYLATTDEIIWQKNSTQEMNPASITKILTCLIAAEKLDINKEVTVAKEATTVPLVERAVYEGEKRTVNELMHLALMVSANDAAAALACEVAGSQKEFAKLMNAKAKELGCTNTNFVNASGVFNEKQHSSAKDIALIAAAAFSNPDVRRISGTREYELPKSNKSSAKTLKNLNLFLEGGELTINEEKTSAKKYK
ncbi:MAG: D-alanyl-D-alanine carboxypeptidase, partial [Firmicutes bacterium]|nr:D-alanyl-D-alanine carboxypeptidase [Bacillota bacterium]